MDPSSIHEFAGVPSRYSGLTMQSLADQAQQIFDQAAAATYLLALEMVREWAASSDWGLVLSGPAGCGKTALAAAVLCERGGRPGWLSATAFVDGVRDKNLTVTTALERANPLVLDDFGAEYATYFSNQALDALVSSAYDDGHGLIITTNLAAEHIPSTYSERMLDRLHDGVTWVNFANPSFRRR